MTRDAMRQVQQPVMAALPAVEADRMWTVLLAAVGDLDPRRARASPATA